MQSVERNKFKLKLINSIYKYNCLWNPIDDSYRNGASRRVALSAISEEMNIIGKLKNRSLKLHNIILNMNMLS